MKVTVFGATGQTGLEVVKQAIERGIDVRAFVRTPEKLGDLRDKVVICKGDIMDNASVTAAIADSDTIISVIGPTRTSQIGFQPKATQTIIAAMQKAGKKRLIVMTGAGIRMDGDNPKLLDKAVVAIMKLAIKKVLTDGYAMKEIVLKSGLDWTIVRAPVLTNKPAAGTYAVGMVGDKHIKPMISRADVATYILNILEDANTYHTTPLVGGKK